MPGPLERLPKTAYMDEPDERAEPLLRAMGRLVWGAASLEKILLQVIALLRAERDGQFPSSKELSRLERAPAGQLLEVLKTLDLPDDLAARIAATIDRRNAIIHRPIEDPEVVQAVVKGENIDVVVTRVEQIALDCGQIAVELQAVTGPRLETCWERRATSWSAYSLLSILSPWPTLARANSSKQYAPWAAPTSPCRGKLSLIAGYCRKAEALARRRAVL